MLRLMAVLAHPDDESLGAGGTLARYASEGVEVHLLTATRGEAGRHGEGDHPGREALGRLREEELRAAADDLGVQDVRVLGYPDGGLSGVDAVAAAGRIAGHVRRVRPQVVLTFDPAGAYGHPDHVAICQLTGAALAYAADASWSGPDGRAGPWLVSKLYWLAWDTASWEIYQRTFKDLVSTVDGTVRRATPWPDWSITTRVDARPWWSTVWRAVCRHRTQMEIYGPLAELDDETHRRLWGDQTFYRVFSTVNGGREIETDLFEGLREEGRDGPSAPTTHDHGGGAR